MFGLVVVFVRNVEFCFELFSNWFVMVCRVVFVLLLIELKLCCDDREFDCRFRIEVGFLKVVDELCFSIFVVVNF